MPSIWYIDLIWRRQNLNSFVSCVTLWFVIRQIWDLVLVNPKDLFIWLVGVSANENEIIHVDKCKYVFDLRHEASQFFIEPVVSSHTNTNIRPRQVDLPFCSSIHRHLHHWSHHITSNNWYEPADYPMSICAVCTEPSQVCACVCGIERLKHRHPKIIIQDLLVPVLLTLLVLMTPADQRRTSLESFDHFKCQFLFCFFLLPFE